MTSVGEGKGRKGNQKIVVVGVQEKKKNVVLRREKRMWQEKNVVNRLKRSRKVWQIGLRGVEGVDRFKISRKVWQIASRGVEGCGKQVQEEQKGVIDRFKRGRRVWQIGLRGVEGYGRRWSRRMWLIGSRVVKEQEKDVVEGFRRRIRLWYKGEEKDVVVGFRGSMWQISSRSVFVCEGKLVFVIVYCVCLCMGE